jgi:hypothetical protein
MTSPTANPSPPPTSMPRDSNILHVEKDYALATFGDVFMVIWRHETSMAGAEALRRECLAFAETRPKGIALLTIIEERAPMPPSDSRACIAGFLRDASEVIRASGVVFEGSGFRAAAVRSIVISLTMLAGQKYPHKVFANLVETAGFLEREAGSSLAIPFTARSLDDDVNAIRREIATRT